MKLDLQSYEQDEGNVSLSEEPDNSFLSSIQEQQNQLNQMVHNKIMIFFTGLCSDLDELFKNNLRFATKEEPAWFSAFSHQVFNSRQNLVAFLVLYRSFEAKAV